MSRTRERRPQATRSAIREVEATRPDASILPFAPSPQLDPGATEQAEANAPGTWWADANAGLDLLAELGDPFTAADLTVLGVPDPDHPCRWGALFAAAARQRRIVKVGAQRSARRTRRGSICLQWIGLPEDRS